MENVCQLKRKTSGGRWVEACLFLSVKLHPLIVNLQ